MSFTYGELKQAVQDFIESSETTLVNNLPIFIRMAEERLLKGVQLSVFQNNTTLTTTSGTPTVTLPADYLASMALAVEDGAGDQSFLLYKDQSFLREYTPDSATTGLPLYYAQKDVDELLLAPTPDATYTLHLQYLYRPASLTAGADSGTTWLSENAELALLYGSLLEANIFLKGDPDMTQLYQARFQEAVMGLKLLGEAKQSTDEYRTGELLRQKA